jgi:hypothetical protein
MTEAMFEDDAAYLLQLADGSVDQSGRGGSLSCATPRIVFGIYLARLSGRIDASRSAASSRAVSFFRARGSAAACPAHVVLRVSYED